VIHFAQNVYVVGNHPDLGDWQPTKAKRMDCKDSKWRVSFIINSSPPLTLKYKYCILNDHQEGGGIPFWEPGGDRELTITNENEVIRHDAWGAGDKAIEVLKGVFPGHLYCSAMPYSTMFDPQQTIFQEWKAINPDCVVILPHREECVDKTGGFDLVVIYGKDAFPLICYEIDDFGVPNHKPSFTLLVDRILKLLGRGEKVIIQSHAGIGRTGLLLGCLLKRIRHTSIPQFKLPDGVILDNNDDVIKWVRGQLRGSLQSEKQIKYVKDF